MTMKNRNKGQMRVIETLLASFIVVLALAFASIFATTPASQQYEATELEKIGYNVLHDLDDQGLLPRFVYNAEWSNLRSALRVTLPSDVYFNLTVYNLNSVRLDDGSVLYGEPLTLATSKHIASITYGLAGYATQIYPPRAVYEPRIVVLQLTRG